MTDTATTAIVAHTPGPWHVVNPPKGALLSDPPQVYGEGWQPVCSLRTRPSHRQGVEEVNNRIAADARLIAAAPEVLAALKSAAESIEQLVKIGRLPANNAGLRDARAAIAKAEGR